MFILPQLINSENEKINHENGFTKENFKKNYEQEHDYMLYWYIYEPNNVQGSTSTFIIK